MHHILIGILQQSKVQALELGLQRCLLVQCDPEAAVDVGLDSCACTTSRGVFAVSAMLYWGISCFVSGADLITQM